MIVFDLRCSAMHVFEAWFGSGAAYDEQRSRGLLACPICADTDVTKAVMAPNIPAKGNSAARSAAPAGAAAEPERQPSPSDVKAALQVIARAQAEMLARSTWVGRGFAETARAMHEGSVAQAPIHGQTTLAEARALIDEGVPVAPLPLPVAPPETVN